MRQRIDVKYLMGDTTQVDVFSASSSVCQIFPDGRGFVEMIDGKDQAGHPVSFKIYRHCESIERRPFGT